MKTYRISGEMGDLVKVKPGYARNYLLPRGLAVVADKRNLGELEHEQRVAAQNRRERALRDVTFPGRKDPGSLRV